jgi:hypothetical protein
MGEPLVNRTQQILEDDAVVSNYIQQNGDGFVWAGTYDDEVRAAYRLIARHVYKLMGLGDFAYRAFEYINTTFFSDRLPEPLILWDLTTYGDCLGWTRSPEDGPPIIKLHPSLVAPSGRKKGLGEHEIPWGIEPGFLGYCYAFHVLLHETVHVAVNYLLGGIDSHPERNKGWSSHQNPLWIAEINRVSEIMGVNVTYDMKKYRRVPTGQVNEKGRAITKLKYACDGPAPENFPHNLPGADDFYRKKELPFAWSKRARKVVVPS